MTDVFRTCTSRRLQTEAFVCHPTDLLQKPGSSSAKGRLPGLLLVRRSFVA
jgi:hypothetical protein